MAGQIWLVTTHPSCGVDEVKVGRSIAANSFSEVLQKGETPPLAAWALALFPFFFFWSFCLDHSHQPPHYSLRPSSR